MNSTTGKLYLGFAFALAGSSAAAARLTDDAGPFTVAAASLAIMLVVLLPVYGRRVLATARSFTRDQWIAVGLQASIGVLAFRSLLLYGLQGTSTGEAGILMGAAPAFTACLAYVFLQERPTRAAVLGIIGTAAGIASLQGGSLGSDGFSSAHLIGNALILCAAGCEAAFNALSRGSSRKADAAGGLRSVHPIVHTLLVGAAALVLCCVPAAFEHPILTLGTIGVKAWLALIWYGLGITALSYACFYAGIKRCDAYTAAAFSGWMPVTALLLSVTLFGERPSLYQWLGGTIMIGSMVLLASKGSSQPELQAASSEVSL